MADALLPFFTSHEGRYHRIDFDDDALQSWRQELKLILDACRQNIRADIRHLPEVLKSQTHINRMVELFRRIGFIVHGDHLLLVLLILAHTEDRAFMTRVIKAVILAHPQGGSFALNLGRYLRRDDVRDAGRYARVLKLLVHLLSNSFITFQVLSELKVRCRDLVNNRLYCRFVFNLLDIVADNPRLVSLAKQQESELVFFDMFPPDQIEFFVAFFRANGREYWAEHLLDMFEENFN